MLELTGRLPDAVAACVGGGSNAIGIFHAFLDDADVEAVRLRGGRRRRRHRAARRDDRARPPRRAARRAQLRAAGRGRPDHRVALDLGRARLPGRRARARAASPTSAAPTTCPATDAEAMEALRLLSRTEGIIPAIESAHALAGALRARPRARARRDHPGEPHPAAATRTWRPPARWFDLFDERRGAVVTGRAVSRRAIRVGERRRAARSIGYLPVGFPDLATSIDAAVALVENGVDVLELGPALLRPGDGRAGDPGGDAGGARRAASGCATCSRPSSEIRSRRRRAGARA